ncbi:hypothetical protein K32_42910 [Kaistia sp. 32K]|uniref:DUF1223 domain-containing protein n=1 Tax=Kaistia sp. 32K TaxID=2795690 RepID=UPI00191663F4|nr:DUF1223 domain-containing protein [Kaistia sp. 32K]BCP55674.1 hypothetical protein K32_42910 [Kaistia sp. 32K]
MFVRKSGWVALAIGVCILTALSASADSVPVPTHPVTAVLELFTSQGCASCPPADEVLEDFAKRPDIVALSLPVDYWDYLGWKDTLARKEFTQRQKAYANARGDRQIYTPQLIVNGRTHVVGSDRTAIEAALKAEQPLSVPIGISTTGDSFQVSIGSNGDPTAPKSRKGTIWLALYKRHVDVPIRKGENQDRTLSYYNVVTKLRPIAMWRGDPTKVDLPMSEYNQAEADGCAILLQAETVDGEPGEMLGAAFIEKGAEW